MYLYIIRFMRVLLYLLLIHASLLQVFVTDNSSREAPHKQKVELAAGVYHVTWTHYRFRHQFLLSNLQGTHHIISHTKFQLVVNKTVKLSILIELMAIIYVNGFFIITSDKHPPMSLMKSTANFWTSSWKKHTKICWYTSHNIICNVTCLRW